MIDQTISALEEVLDPSVFFRANRKYLVNIHFIRGFKVVDRVKLELTLKVAVKDDHRIIISQRNAASFKKWISEDTDAGDCNQAEYETIYKDGTYE